MYCRSIRASLVSILLSVATVANAAGCVATSATDLLAQFERSLKSKDETALLALFKWDGIEPELQGSLKREFARLLASEFIRAELRDGSLATNDAKELEAKGYFLNVSPVATLYFERSVGPRVIDPREKTGGRFAVGTEGKCFVLGAYSKSKRN